MFNEIIEKYLKYEILAFRSILHCNALGSHYIYGCPNQWIHWDVSAMHWDLTILMDDQTNGHQLNLLGCLQ